MHILFAFTIAIIAAVFVGADASKRGMNSLGWAIGTFFLCIIFLPLYLIVRKPVMPPPVPYPPPPGTYPPQQPGALPPQQAGSRLCSNCGKYHEVNARFCPFCGAPQG